MTPLAWCGCVLLVLLVALAFGAFAAAGGREPEL